MRVSLVAQTPGYSVTRKHSNKNRNVAALIPAGSPQVSPPPPAPQSSLWEGNECYAPKDFSKLTKSKWFHFV